MLVQLGWLLGSRGQAEYLVAVFQRRLGLPYGLPYELVQIPWGGVTKCLVGTPPLGGRLWVCTCAV